MRFRNSIIRLFAGALILGLCFGFCACGDQTDTAEVQTGARETAVGETTAGEAPQQPEFEHRKIIIDTDTGADDASALILAAKLPDIEILGVTVLVGNVDLEQSTENALAALELVGCGAPVYKGSADTYDGTVKSASGVFGSDGMGDAGLIHPAKQAEEGDATDFIIKTIEENPGEVEILSLGPATNIAKAIEKAPDSMKKVKRIWSMGTAGLGSGNASPVAEYNVYSDAQAYKILLDSGLPITVVGLDMCVGEAMWTDAQFDELGKLNETGDFVAKSFGKLREFYKGNGSDGVMNCDSMAAMCALYPGFIISTVNTHASCIVDKGETYAEVLFYKEGFTYDVVTNDYDYHVTLVTGADQAAYFENYKNAVS